MEYVWIIQQYMNGNPRTERYELIKRNSESVTVQCRCEPKVIKFAAGRSFYYDEESVKAALKRITERSLSVAQGAVRDLTELLKTQNFEIYEVPGNTGR
jgi:hypothetical protein